MDQAEDLDSLWKAYCLAEDRGPRARTMELLYTVISRLFALPDEERRAWVESFLTGPPFTSVRFPLFDKVILPILSRGVLEARPNYARWLGRA